MTKCKFTGHYSGKYTETVLENGVVTETDGTATVTIKKLASNVYSIRTVVGRTSVYTNLAYLEGDILRAEAQSGQGVSSTYFEGCYLTHRLSISDSPTYRVIIYKVKKI